MSDIPRFSSCRIVGFFRSPIFELVGEAIAAIPTVQIVRNSKLDEADVVIQRLRSRAELARALGHSGLSGGLRRALQGDNNGTKGT